MWIVSVEENSIADELDIRAGEELLGINGKAVRDAIDYEYYMAESALLLLLRSQAGEEYEAEIEKEPFEPLGLAFENDGFSKKKMCANKCVFCFVDQMPKGLRQTLYVKDDDWRMSFLMGSYITLTNLSEDEIVRIIEQKISPLYISVHAGDDGVRADLLQNKRAEGMFAIMERFAQNGIFMHAQVVLCEGINDGKVLENTLERLYGLYPAVLSVAVVPVGLTKYRDGLYPLAPVSREGAQKALETIHQWQKKCMAQAGTRFAFASDELYIRAAAPLPAYGEYEDFCQIENGVGLIAKFGHEVEDALQDINGTVSTKSFAVVTGADSAPYIRKAVGMVRNALPVEIEVYAVENRFFGETVTVSGLLTGQDVIAQLRGKIKEDVLLLPGAMFRECEDVMLDGTTLEELEAALGMECRIVNVDGYCFVEQFFV